MHILFVCLGNICRSPMAHGFQEKKIGKDFSIDSAGILDFHEGNPPDCRAIEAMRQKGIDISSQKSRPIQKKDFKNFDLILALDTSVFEQLQSFIKDDILKKKVHLYLDYVGLKGDVKDPYYSSDDAFSDLANLLDDTTDKLIQKIRSNSPA